MERPNRGIAQRFEASGGSIFGNTKPDGGVWRYLGFRKGAAHVIGKRQTRSSQGDV